MFLSKTRTKLNLYSFQKRFFEQDFQFMRQNNKAYFDIAIDKNPVGRLTFELFTKYTPRTALNFYNFCKGFQNKEGKMISYKHTQFHKVIPGMFIQGGQVSENNSLSYYGKQFADENYVISHEPVGILSMANNGVNTNGSQFFITTSDCSWFDGKHVAFGKVVEGIDVLNKIEATGKINGELKSVVEIIDCGVIEQPEEEHHDEHHDEHHHDGHHDDHHGHNHDKGHHH